MWCLLSWLDELILGIWIGMYIRFILHKIKINNKKKQKKNGIRPFIGSVTFFGLKKSLTSGVKKLNKLITNP